MHNYFQDIVHAVRALLRARAFTAVCVISLGLGMGVVIGVFLFMRMVFGATDDLHDPSRDSGRGLISQAGNGDRVPSGRILMLAGFRSL